MKEQKRRFESGKRKEEKKKDGKKIGSGMSNSYYKVKQRKNEETKDCDKRTVHA